MRVTFKKFDVRPLLAQGIEPFGAIRERIDRLEEGEGLLVIAPFLPSPLIERLGGEGFQAKVERQADGGWSVRFWREEDLSA